MKTHSVFKSILFILLTAGLSSAVANKGRTVKPANKKPMTQQVQKSQEAKKQLDKNNAAINAILSGLHVKNSQKNFSKTEANTIVERLNLKEGLTQTVQKNLVKAIVSNPIVGESVQAVSKKVKQASKEDVVTVVEFAASMKSVYPVSKNRSIPHYENTALLLVKNMADALTWETSSKNSFMSLLKEITTIRNKGSHVISAVSQALKNRGYNTVEKVIKRQKEIREKCNKAA